jgi:Sec-independent protein translocase protein TatA
MKPEPLGSHLKEFQKASLKESAKQPESKEDKKKREKDERAAKKATQGAGPGVDDPPAEATVTTKDPWAEQFGKQQ